MRRRPGVIATGPPSFVSAPANRSEMKGSLGTPAVLIPPKIASAKCSLRKLAASLILRGVDRHHSVAEQLGY